MLPAGANAVRRRDYTKKAATTLTDDLAQRNVACLDRSGDVLLAHKVGAEEHERVRRAGDMAFRAALATGAAFHLRRTRRG